MTQQTNKPSDPTDNPWDDMNVTPVAPSKDHHAAGDLYTAKPSAGTEGMGLAFFWVGHPWAFPVILVGIVLYAILSFAQSYSQKTEREDAKKVAIADMANFQKTRKDLGMERTCLVIEQKNVPAQYGPECRAIKAAAKAKEARK